jgi:hypothetical protein
MIILHLASRLKPVNGPLEAGTTKPQSPVGAFFVAERWNECADARQFAANSAPALALLQHSRLDLG